MLFREEDKAVLECILFASVEAVTIGQLTKAMEWKKEEASELLKILQLEYLTRNSGLELAEIAGGWKLRTKAEHASALEKFFKPLRNRLTKAALETLAIIAYNQPITKMDIENIRSVKVDSVVSNLMEKGLIQEDGRKNSPGRPILYAVSAEFLQHFGINSVEDLPPLPPAEEG
ncbi:MAG: SMC-Scp complex subunit ScpB [Clostridia bacterium]